MIDIYKICSNKSVFITSILEKEWIGLQDIFEKYYKKTEYKLTEYNDLSIKNSTLSVLLKILKANLSKWYLICRRLKEETLLYANLPI